MSKFTVSQYAAAYQAAVKDKTGKDREEIAYQLIKLLARQRRIKMITRIISALERLIAEAGGPMVVKVKSVKTMDEQISLKLKQQLEKFLNRPVKIRSQASPRILAGVKIQVGDQLVDNSLASRLNDLKQQLLTNF